jgi:dihydroorotate dehydrogenase
LRRALGALGFGHVEVGTLTPRPQPGNPKPRVFRLPQDQAIINRMGFPNGGVEEALPRLRRLAQRGAAERGFVLGVSLGKQKETALEAAAEDYIAVLRATYAFGDYFAVNISSPNTAGLRALQGRELLDGLLGPLMQARAALAEGEGRRGKPLLLKIAPDLESDELDAVLGAIDAHGVDGIIATNTTLSREGLTGEARHETGGMSGRPLAARATAMIRAIRERTEGALPIIGVGGIFDARDVREKLDAGASLVQVYSGMVYEGPGMAGRILRELTRQ